jgi:predicted amidophosphoribosyltransferase
MNLDRFRHRIESGPRCVECGAPVRLGEEICEACREEYEFDRYEEQYKLGLRKCAYSWLNREEEIESGEEGCLGNS